MFFCAATRRCSRCARSGLRVEVGGCAEFFDLAVMLVSLFCGTPVSPDRDVGEKTPRKLLISLKNSLFFSGEIQHHTKACNLLIYIDFFGRWGGADCSAPLD